MTITIDHKIYSDACISRVAYWLSSQYTISRSLDGDIETMSVCGSIDSEDQLSNKISQQLNDYKLREIVEKETHDIRTILYAKAFADCEDLEA